MPRLHASTTIAAIATPPGLGGVAIVRISGTGVPAIAHALIGRLPAPRKAVFTRFLASDGEPIDEGIALYFPAPNSFTGEAVLELQGHGGPVVMDLLLTRVLDLGARIAGPGEFSRRAFLNGKLDLAQAEAIADLIESGTAAAARLALRSLEGAFSRHIDDLLEQLTQLRIYVEAAIDFPDEEIDFLAEEKVSADLRLIQERLNTTEASARTGRLLRDGLNLVIAGPPNAGKSSLMNALAGWEAAIVTEIPGTTRDLLRERIQIDGLPLHLIDTAGLRESEDRVEREGVRRAREEIARADRILWVFDDRTDPAHDGFERAVLPEGIPVLFLRNKIDLTGSTAGLRQTNTGTEIALSVQTGEGMEILREHLKQCAGYTGEQEGEFLARRRHLDALRRAAECLDRGRELLEKTGSGELLAEELRLAQQHLGEITGEFGADDLLGRIFDSFCIGK